MNLSWVRPLALGMFHGLSGMSTQAQTWDWQLSEPFDYTAQFQVLNIDPDNVTAREVKALKRNGVYLICYISVGTLERYREDRPRFPDMVRGNGYDGPYDEIYLDIRRLDILLPLMKARFQKCKDMGFDAIEPDNMDVFEAPSGFPLTRKHGHRYIFELANIAHGMGLRIGQKNLPDHTDDLIKAMDFVITEDCFEDGWCDEVLPYIKAQKPVFAAEYTDTDVDFKKACAYAKRHQISMILKDRDLTKWRKGCS